MPDYAKHMIVEDGFQNVTVAGQVTGFQFGVRVAYYRGIQLSLLEDIRISVDGEAYPRAVIRVTLHGNTYTLDEMEQELTDRWEFGEVGIVAVAKPGGLAPGPHRIDLTEQLRISYMPRPAVHQASKTVELAS